MASYVKSVTFDCSSALLLAGFWAGALGSNVDEDSTDERAKNRQHFDLRAMGPVDAEVDRLVALGATVVGGDGDLVVMADPEGNEFCVEP